MSDPPPPPPPSEGDFRIAVICALGKEGNTVDKFWDYVWEPEVLDFSPPKQVRVGLMGQHRIVLAWSQKAGKVEAGIAASAVDTVFPNIELVLVVGICAGKPGIPMGDTIIGMEILPYDSGKQLDTGFLPTDPVIKPDPKFGMFFSKLKSDYDTKALMKAAQGHFKAKYLDAQGRKPKPNEIEKPDVHFGLVASGDKLIRSAEFRDSLKAQDGDKPIGFEMEAAGVKGVYPGRTFVIKGVVDHADKNKNDEFHEVAAFSGAAYMRAFLDKWQPRKSRGKELFSEMSKAARARLHSNADVTPKETARPPKGAIGSLVGVLPIPLPGGTATLRQERVPPPNSRANSPSRLKDANNLNPSTSNRETPLLQVPGQSNDGNNSTQREQGHHLPTPGIAVIDFASPTNHAGDTHPPPERPREVASADAASHRISQHRLAEDEDPQDPPPKYSKTPDMQTLEELHRVEEALGLLKKQLEARQASDQPASENAGATSTADETKAGTASQPAPKPDIHTGEKDSVVTAVGEIVITPPQPDKPPITLQFNVTEVDVPEDLTEIPAPKALKEAPAPEALPKIPAPEALKEVPAPKALTETPAPETLKEVPAPKAVPQVPVPEAVKEAPAPEALPEDPAPKVSKPPEKDAQKTTQLLEACQERNLDVVKALLQTPAILDLTTTDPDGGRNLLHLVLGTGKVTRNSSEMKTIAKIVDLLCKNGVNPNAPDPVGLSAIHYAVKTFNTLATEVLLRRGVDVNTPDLGGRTAAYYTAVDTNPDVKFVKKLIEHGAKVGSTRPSRLPAKARPGMKEVRTLLGL